MKLPRLQLFELEDQPWFPTTICDFATDYLQFVQSQFSLHKSVVALLCDALEKSGMALVLDLCSGGGGPVLAVHEKLLRAGISVRFTLTDQYPNLSAFRRLSALHPSRIAFVADSVDATKVPREFPGMQTMFNAFYHFAPVQSCAILECAVEAGQPIDNIRNSGACVNHDRSAPLDTAFCSRRDTIHSPFFVAASALDLRVPASATQLLVGRLGVAVPGVHGGGNAGADARTRSL